MKVKVENSWSWVGEAVEKEISWLDDFLSVPVSNYYAGVGWQEDRFRMMSQVGHRFASGWFPLAVAQGVKDDVAVEMLDMRGDPPCTPEPGADLAWLRDYQVAAARAALAQERGLVKVPTGGGKTEIIVAMTRLLPCEHLMLVHRSDLVGQAAARYQLRTGERAGSFEAGTWKRGTCNLTVATFQSVYRALRQKKKPKGLLELVSGVGCLQIDEVHGQSADSYYRVTQCFVNARHRFGFSGTPLHRSDVDAMRTVGAIGPVAYEITYETLVDAGVLARPTARMARFDHKEQRVKDGRSWRDVYETRIVRCKARNKMLADMADACGKPCLMFVDEISHGEFMLAHLRASGLRAEFAHGDHFMAHRRRMLQDLADGLLDVLVCTVIFQEGIDVPALRGVIVGGGKSSAVACLQRVGRGMRRAPGKETFEVWDIKDEGQVWLEAHASDRLSTLQGEGIPVEVLDGL